MDFKARFPRPMTLFVVVHAETVEQVLRNVDRVLTADADGVFLINHAISDDDLVGCYDAARRRFADAWIGLSFMRLSARASLRLAPQSVSGLWVSDAGIEEFGPQPPEVMSFAEARAAQGWEGVYFGGVAFKHQRPVSDPATAAAAAAPFVDVITTSGTATGSAAPVNKIAAMRAAVGPHPLALASGVSAANAHEYLGLADCVLAASSVSDSEAELSPKRLKDLAGVIHLLA